MKTITMTLDAAREWLGDKVSLGEFEVRVHNYGYFPAMIGSYTATISDPVLVKIVDNSEYDHGNGD